MPVDGPSVQIIFRSVIDCGVTPGKALGIDISVRKIIHIDMDAFFASIEQRDNPELRGRPVAVGYAAKRGVVAAASYEARTFGVRSAMPSVTALRKCPHLVFVPPRFEVYRAVSMEIRAIFLEYTPIIEPLSLDEAFLDVTENLRGVPTASQMAKEIRARIRELTGLTASAGVSYNKFLAKLASDQRKPNGQFVVPPEMGEAFVEGLPIERFHGVGPVTAEKMKRLGIHTGVDLKQKALLFLEEHFGRSAAWYFGIARGQDDRPVVPNRPRKSSGSETTFDRDLFLAEEIEEGILRMAEDVWVWCQDKQIYGQTVTVKVKYADFQTVTRSRTLQSPIRSPAHLRELCVALVRMVYPVTIGIRLVGVSVSKLSQGGETILQMDLPIGDGED
jgi:DNA polymerase-4